MSVNIQELYTSHSLKCNENLHSVLIMRLHWLTPSGRYKMSAVLQTIFNAIFFKLNYGYRGMIVVQLMSICGKINMFKPNWIMELQNYGVLSPRPSISLSKIKKSTKLSHHDFLSPKCIAICILQLLPDEQYVLIKLRQKYYLCIFIAGMLIENKIVV